MSAVLALSASHLAWETNDAETEHLAYHHRGVALKGLHEAIGSFSRDNSEAILAASMLLSWQATEWYVSDHMDSRTNQTDTYDATGEAGLLSNKASQQFVQPLLLTPPPPLSTPKRLASHLSFPV
jgi:hypothetical protein